MYFSGKVGLALRDNGDDDGGNNESYGVVATHSFNKHLLSTYYVPAILRRNPIRFIV